jgi:Skp family chaperone for outer membrane proteins
MKKLAVTLFVMTLITSAFAATVGFIDVEQVFKSYNKTKAAQEDINNKMKEYKKAVAKYQQKMEDAKIDGKTDKDIEKIKEEMQKELDPQETEIKMLNEEKMSKIRKDIVTAVDGVAKELGVDVVLDKQVIITGGNDLTDMTIEKLNKK